MKKISLHIIIVALSGLFVLSSLSLIAQEIKKETREVSSFTGLDAGGAFEIYLSQGEAIKVVVEADAKHIDKVKTKVNGGVLELSSTGIKNANYLKV